MSKAPQCFADTLPIHFRRACGVMSGDGGFKAWLDVRFNPKKWAVCDYPRGDIEIAVTNRELSDLAVEYGFQRLVKIFGTLDPVAEAASLTEQQRRTGETP